MVCLIGEKERVHVWRWAGERQILGAQVNTTQAFHILLDYCPCCTKFVRDVYFIKGWGGFGFFFFQILGKCNQLKATQKNDHGNEMQLTFEGQLEEFRVRSGALKSSLNPTACIVFNWAVTACVCVCVSCLHTPVLFPLLFSQCVLCNRGGPDVDRSGDFRPSR